MHSGRATVVISLVPAKLSDFLGKCETLLFSDGDFNGSF